MADEAQAPSADETSHITIRWGAETYSTGELTAADMIEMEEAFGGTPFSQIDFRSIKASCWLVYLARRQHEPDLDFDDVAAITARALIEQAEAGDVPPPDAAPSPRRGSARSGRRTTRASTASDPGNSGD